MYAETRRTIHPFQLVTSVGRSSSRPKTLMASKTLRFLSSSQVMMLHAMRIARAKPWQPGLLESAVLSPINTNAYERQDDVFHLAAILAQKIMKNHAFRDGNKRTALIAADVFL
ncbi:hypothetical protein IWZ01DRAFT_370961 [Phyllosticta capitalensis]